MKNIMLFFGMSNIRKNNFINLIDSLIKNNYEVIKKIDGQFLMLVVSKETNKVSIVSDRFNGINLYYAHIENKLLCSNSYYLIAKNLKILGKFEWSKKIIYDVIRMNRVFGYDTYDKSSNFYLHQSILKFDFSELVLYSYWKPRFKKLQYRSKRFVVKNISHFKKVY